MSDKKNLEQTFENTFMSVSMLDLPYSIVSDLPAHWWLIRSPLLTQIHRAHSSPLVLPITYAKSLWILVILYYFNLAPLWNKRRPQISSTAFVKIFNKHRPPINAASETSKIFLLEKIVVNAAIFKIQWKINRKIVINANNVTYVALVLSKEWSKKTK